MMSAMDDDSSFDTAEEIDVLAETECAVRLSTIDQTASLGENTSLDGSQGPAQWEHRPLLDRQDSDTTEDDLEPVDDDADYDEQTYTVEDAVETIGFGWFQVQVIATSGLFTMTDALEMLLLAVLGPIVRCEWMLDNHEVAFITTVVFIGMFSGSAIWGKWSDLYGRKPILMLAAVWIFYMGILTAFSPSYYWLLILRGLVGSGFGGAVQSFTLLSEYLPSKSRAKILIVQNFTWAIGSCFEMLLAYWVIPTLGWRWLVALSALPMLLTILSVKSLPESARYLVAAGRKEEGLRVLQQAARWNGRQLPKGTLVASKPAPRGQVRDLLRGQYGRVTIQLWIMWLVTAFSYYGVVLLSSDPVLHDYPHTCHGEVTCSRQMATLHAELIEAIKAGEVHVVRDVMRTSGFDNKPKLKGQLLLVAIEEDQTEVVELLCKDGPWTSSVRSDDLTAVHVACKYGNVRIIEALLRNGVGVNDRSPLHSLTPLFIAVRWGQRDAVLHLLDAGADANLTSGQYKNATSPLHEAADAGFEDILDLLLAARADVNAINGMRQLPLHLCCRAAKPGHPHHTGSQMAKRLIDCGSYVNVVDLAGNSPLHLAVKRTSQDGSMSLLHLLCVSGAHIGAYNDRGDTALHIAALGAALDMATPGEHFVNITKLLLNFGAKVNRTNVHGQTPLRTLLVEGFRLPVVDVLVEAGSDINHCDEFGETLFHSCCKSWGMHESVLYLLRHGVLYDTVCRKKLSPLSSAVISNHRPTIRTLCQESPGLLRPAHSIVDVSGRPLNYAAKVQAPDMVEYLLAAGYRWTRDEIEYIRAWSGLPGAVCAMFDRLLHRPLVPRLDTICRDLIRLCLWDHLWKNARRLPLPTRLQDQLLLLDI